MTKVNAILKDARYRRYCEHIEELETDRIFCHHDMGHFLEGARIMVIMAEDEGITIDREVIYAAALLHDIGRGRQYEDGTAHEEESARIAPGILRDCGFDEEETAMITKAIRDHGDESVKEDAGLSGLLYRADKSSRKCFMCAAVDKCHKPEEKLVMEIRY